MKLLLLGAALLTPFACAAALDELPSTAEARLRASHTRSFYDIVGSTFEELRANLDANGQEGPDGRFDARTSFQINWRYGYAEDASGCRPAEVEVDLRMTTVLPRWNQDPQAAEAVVKRWSGYAEALALHEDGHADLVKQAASEVLAAIERLPAQPTCDEVSALVDRTGKSIVARVVRENGRYDDETGHGRTQGAIFP